MHGDYICDLHFNLPLCFFDGFDCKISDQTNTEDILLIGMGERSNDKLNNKIFFLDTKHHTQYLDIPPLPLSDKVVSFYLENSVIACGETHDLAEGLESDCVCFDVANTQHMWLSLGIQRAAWKKGKHHCSRWIRDQDCCRSQPQSDSWPGLGRRGPQLDLELLCVLRNSRCDTLLPLFN